MTDEQVLCIITIGQALRMAKRELTEPKQQEEIREALECLEKIAEHYWLGPPRDMAEYFPFLKKKD